MTHIRRALAAACCKLIDGLSWLALWLDPVKPAPGFEARLAKRLAPERELRKRRNGGTSD